MMLPKTIFENWQSDNNVRTVSGCFNCYYGIKVVDVARFICTKFLDEIKDGDIPVDTAQMPSYKVCDRWKSRERT